VFDLLGYMWLPILGNFLHIIFVIFCIFGVNQRKPNYIYSYCIWSLVWIAWNAFVTCYYMEVGSLDRGEDVLSLGTNSFSWWMANGYGCRPVYYHNISNELIIDAMERNVYHPLRPSEVNGCLMEWYYVEVIHAGVQVILAALGMSASMYLVYLFVTDRQKRQGTPQKALYSIEYSPQVNETANLGGIPDNELYANAAVMKENQGHMTPRRVKRRSYTRSSARSAKSLNRTKRSAAANRAYSSMKQPRGSKSSGAINPVTRLLDLDPASHARQRQNAGAAAAAAGLDSSTSNDVEQAYGQVNPAYESSRPNSIYSSSTANGPGVVSRLPGGGGGGGHNGNPMDSSRPPSALTSYSNFHGQRKHAPNHFVGINLTQDTFVQPPPPQNGSIPNPNGGGNQNAQMNSSFDDLPPPPPPIAEDADIAAPPAQPGRSAMARPQAPLPAPSSPSLAGAPQSSPRLPVPQQRNPKRNEHVEYVNTVSQHHSSAPQAQVQHIHQQQQQHQQHRQQQHQQQHLQQQQQQHHQLQQLDSSLSSDVNIYNDDPGNMQTLRANDRLLLPPPRNASTENSTRYYKSTTDTPDASTGARAKQYNGYGGSASTQNDRIPNGRPPARPPTGMRNGYGHSGGRNGMYQDRALPPQPNSLSNGAPSSEDDYGFTSMPATSKPQRPSQGTAEHDYMRDPMKPVGAKMHGGNCKCYRCQRKLTAI